MKRRVGLFAFGSLATLWLASALKPTRRADDLYSPIELGSQVPSSFADWRVDPTIIPILPDPEIRRKLDEIYSQTLARAYINSTGDKIMLSVAYGVDQKSEATQAHRPEICYAAQGFMVTDRGYEWLSFGNYRLRAARVLATLGPRVEYITYWVTLNDKAVLPGFTRKLSQIYFGLGGLIPDGLLFRISTVGLPEREAYNIQDKFLMQLFDSLQASARVRYFGG